MASIAIFTDKGNWHADMTNADGAEEIRALFNSYILPTPFTSRTAEYEVKRELARRNPGHTIVVHK